MNRQGTQTKWILILTSLGFFMSMMDSMIVTTASTAIRLDFRITVGTLQWALNAYNITIAAVLLVGVALGERYGRRRVYSYGLVVFTLGSILCALATNITWLIIARVVEGMGASVMTPLSMAILTHALPVSERGRALGIWSGVGGLALVVGPSLGGLIVARLSWQWIFWINVPVGVVALGLTGRLLPESYGRRERLSGLDAILIMVASAGLIWALSALTSAQVDRGVVMSIGSGSGLLGAWFIWRQKQAAQPLMPLNFFHSAVFRGGNWATFLLYASIYGVVFFLPQFFQIVGQANALTAGLELLPWTGTLVMVAPFTGWAVDRFGERRMAMLGLLNQGVGYGALAGLAAPTRGYGWYVGPLILAGCGLSMAGPALQKAVLSTVAPVALGKASGIYNVFRLLGGAIGTTLAVAVFGYFGRVQTAVTFTQGFQAAMILAAGLSLLGLWYARLLTSGD